jgi:hypothetical protein
MRDPLDLTLTENDAQLLRELPCPIYFDRPDPVCETREDLRRWELMILMDDLMWVLAEGKQNPTVSLAELLEHKDLRIEMAWELCKSQWLEAYGHDLHGQASRN